jgi:predicted DNA-binding transcriptional regulator YafY
MPRYSTAQRLEVLRIALESRRLSYLDMEEQLGISRSTAQRLVRVLRTSHMVIEEENEETQRTVFHIPKAAKGERVRVSALELFALHSGSRRRCGLRTRSFCAVSNARSTTSSRAGGASTRSASTT